MLHVLPQPLQHIDNLQNTPSCLSDDAGGYFCEFRMYSSLAEPLLNEAFRDKRGRVVFEHLPQNHSPAEIALARDITVAYITGLVDSCQEAEENLNSK